MAISINQEPKDVTLYFLTAGYNPLEYVLSSSNVSQANFKFYMDVYVNATKIDRLKRLPHPTELVGVFDISNIVTPYLSYDHTIASVASQTCPNSYVKVQCYMGEEYGLSSTGTTVYAPDATGQPFYPCSASLETFEWIDVDYNDYTLSGSTSKFLTNKPRTFNLFTNQYDWLAFHSTINNRAYQFDVTTYNSAGTLLNSFEIYNAYPNAATTDDHKFVRIASGWNLNNIPNTSGYFIVGSQPILDSNVAYYTIQIKDTGGNNKRSEEFFFYLQEECYDFEVYELHFQNRWGFFDTFQFRRRSDEQVSIDRRQYKQNVGTLSAGLLTNAKSDRGYLDYYTASEKVIKLRSGWITEDEFTWLQELIDSPMVFQRDMTTNDLLAINIVTASYERKKEENTNLINVEIDIKYSVKDYRQTY